MSEESAKSTPPFCAFSALQKLADDHRDNGVPGKIDKTVFGTKGGGTVYSIIAALKYLNFIEDDGTPTVLWRQFVSFNESGRKDVVRELLPASYPALFGSGFDLTVASAGQFNDALREAYKIGGSTVDKVATFFIAACKFAEVELSHHLLKRKPFAPSSSAKRRKPTSPHEEADAERANITPSSRAHSKPLEYQLIDLMSEPDIEEEIKGSIWNLVQYLTARKARSEP